MRKIQQYCDVVDRMKQDPACKQAVLEKARRPRISLTKRGMVTGSAAAAALIALNVGIGGYILHKAADDSMTANSETIEVTETAAVTTAAELIPELTLTEATTAKPQKLSGEKTVTVTAADTARETLIVPKTVTEPAATEPAAQTTQTTAPPKQDPVQPAAEVKPKTDGLSYMLVPADRAYTFAGDAAEEPIVMHVKPGEPVRMQLKVWNDPGVASFWISYNMSECALLSGTGSQYYGCTVGSGGLHESKYSKDRSLHFEGTGDGSSKAPDGAAVAECTLIAPSMPGSYLIQDRTAEILAVWYTVSGVQIIVDADETAQDSAAQYLVDPETVEGLTVYVEPVTAHAGQKNVPVNICVKGNAPFASGGVEIDYDPALKSLLFDHDTEDDTTTASEADRLGISVDGTLLEHAPLLNSSTMFGSLIQVFFNNYRGFRLDNNVTTIIKNGETQADAAITEEGILFTIYFDMPEECGNYRITPTDCGLNGGASEEQGDYFRQTVQNCLPGVIKVIP